MDILGNGIDYNTRKRLIGKLSANELADRLMRSFPHETMERDTRSYERGHKHRKNFAIREVEPGRSVNRYSTVEAGWTYLVNGKDPDKDEIIKTIRTLAEHRKMEDPDSPLEFNNEHEYQWADWLEKKYWNLADWSRRLRRIPEYIMIVGGPDKIPFRFQVMLDCTASVGRVAFDTVQELKNYVDKVIRLETAKEPAVDREVVLFAPRGDSEDATAYSYQYMALPMADHIASELGFEVTSMLENEASKENLAKTLESRKPAVVYSASHGMGAAGCPLDLQKRINGAICCQGVERSSGDECLYSAEDIPSDRSFLDGSVFFQFACFGYGTPAISDFYHWFREPTLNAEEDFVAAIPKKLLSLPEGPIAYIGHLDAAWVVGFMDPSERFKPISWHSRIRPFKSAVETLLAARPVGLAVEDMNKRLAEHNQAITSAYDTFQEEGNLTKQAIESLAGSFIFRTDAQNYMVFGDPAARVRIPESS